MNSAMTRKRSARVMVSWVPRTFVAGLLLCAAGLASGQACFIRSNPVPGTTLTFPTLDPSVAALQRAQTAPIFVNCSTRPAWVLSSPGGGAQLRLTHTTPGSAAFIPYSAAVQYVDGPDSNQRWQVTATILGADYQNAPAGTYAGVLIATILP